MWNFCVVFLCCIISCCIFSVILKPLQSLQQLPLLSFWNIFGQTLKKKVFPGRSWATGTDILTCDLSVFISKLSYCNQVELSAIFMVVFADL